MSGSAEGNRRLRQKERKVYIDEIDEDELDSGNKRQFSVDEKVRSPKFASDGVLKEMNGEDVTLKYLQESGLKSPILVKEKSGLGMRIPGENFTVTDVRQCVGSRRVLDVMDVTSQKALEMTMKEWVNYFENPVKDRLLNVISLEFSHTRLENYVEQPTMVRQMDWVDTVWPSHLKEGQTETTNVLDQMKYPKVQKYCLMSVGGCYTDFHIDMGGTSVWYHILKGSKVFWLIPPTDENLDLFEKWVKSGRQGDSFFGDKVKDCVRVRLDKGNTFFIPTGWIHAVHTPEDSLVFGGNFLHSFNIEMQLRIWEIESRTHVPSKFRYPFFTELHWYVLDQYLNCMLGKSYRMKSTEELKAEREDNRDDSFSVKTEDEADFSSPRRSCGCGKILCNSSSCNGSEMGKSRNNRMPKLSAKLSEEAKSLIRPVSVKLENCLLMDRQKLLASLREPEKKTKKPKISLTKFESKGLCVLVEWLRQLPPTKKLVPKDITDPDQLLADMKNLLDDHCADDLADACTGVSIIKWPARKIAKLKVRGYTSCFRRPKVPKRPAGQKANHRRRRVRCKHCEPCTRDDCRLCSFCKDMRKFGGPGTMKQSCISRQCIRPELPTTACCMVCLKQRSADDAPEQTIFECGICWEIMHPKCYKIKHSAITSEGLINEDLPNSWECPKCVEDGKHGQLYVRTRPKCKVPDGVEYTPSPTPTFATSSISPVPSLQDSDVENHKVSPVTSSLLPDGDDNDLVTDKLHAQTDPPLKDTPKQNGLDRPRAGVRRSRSVDNSVTSPPRKILRVELTPLREFSPRIRSITTKSMTRSRQSLPVLSLLKSPQTTAKNNCCPKAEASIIKVNSRGREINLPSRFL